MDPVHDVTHASDAHGTAAPALDPAGTGTEYPDVTPEYADVTPEYLDLTPAQRGMWFAETLSPEYSVNVAQYLDIRFAPGAFDHDLFAECNLAASRAIESPYTRLVDRPDGTPAQVIDFDVPIEVDILDFRAEADPEAAAMAWMRGEYQRPLDIRTDMLVVTTLLRIADDRTFWYGRGHHIVIDGYAALTLVRMTVDRYNAARRGTEVDEKPAATMADIVADEAKYQASTRRAADAEYWRGRVAHLPEKTTLSTRGAGAQLSAANLVVSAEMDPALQQAVEATARELNSSAAVVLSTAFAAYLNRATGNNDVVLALPVTGRATAKIKRAGGMVSNVLPVRLALDPSATVADLLGRAQVELTGALRHQRYRAEDIWRDAGGSGAPSFGPIVNMVFFDSPIEVDGASVDYHILTSGILEDLLLNLYQASPGAPLVVDLHANPDAYTVDELATHHRRFLLFLDGFVQASTTGATLARLPFGMADEPSPELLGPEPAPPATLAQRYAAIARRHPDAPAVIDPQGEQLAYRDLDEQSTRLAHWLVGRGVGPESLVGLVLPRGIDLIVAVWAVGKAGAAFVPIDPDYPRARVEFLIERSHAQLVLSRGAYAADLGGGARNWVDLADAATVGEIAAAPGDGLPAGGRPENAAYVMFTSGSTGTPKGAVVTHRGAANLVDSIGPDIALGAGSRVLGFASPSFDAFVYELLVAVRTGAAIVFRPETARGGDELAAFLRESRIDFACLTPTVAATVNPADAPDLAIVTLAGEAVPEALVVEWSRAGRAVINGYGPAETTVGASFSLPLCPGEPVAIGDPVNGVGLRLLDTMLAPVPIGVAGELYISGTAVGRGYFEQPRLTAERFVANPFAPGTRMYRTGDIGRWEIGALGEPELVILGRRDFQVKLRGQRVELGEIEAALREQDGVEDVVVVGVNTDGKVDRKAAALVAYVVCDDADAGTRLRDSIEDRLPAHLVPSHIVVLDDLPRNPSGKVERTALPPLDLAANRAEYVAPRSEVEHRLVELVSDLTGSDLVGVGDNLFRLGADSLSASRLAYRVRTELGADLRMADYFDSENLAALAERIVHERRHGQGSRPALVAGERPEVIGVSAAQTRLWFINRMDPASPTYNMPGAVRLGPDADVAALRAAIADVVVRHEVLRTTFGEVDGEPTQVILPVEQVSEEVLRVVGAPDLDAALAAEASLGFDLTSAVPFRATLLRGDDGDVLLIVLHHIAADGASLRPLIADIVVAYNARTHGFAPFFPALPVQYADYSLWHRDLLGAADDPESLANRELQFWAQALDGAPEVLALPSDHPRPRTPSGAGGFVDLDLPGATVAAFHELAAEAGVTVFSVLQAALTVVLARLADTDDVVIGTAVAGRDEPELADLVGMFVNTVALRARFDPAQDAIGLLRAVQTGRARALSHATVPFEQVVDAVAHTHTLSYSPVFQVALTMQDDAFDTITTSFLDAELVSARIPAAKYDLSVTAVQHAGEGSGFGRMAVEFSYSTDLFEQATVTGFADAFERVLTAMLAAPTEPLGRIDLLSPERIAELTAVPVRVAQPTSLRAIVTAWLAAGRARDEQALLRGHAPISADAASSRINQLARELIARGAGPGATVAISIPRSVNSVMSMLSVALTGATYVFIDPAHPLGRRASLIQDSGSFLGITAQPVAAGVVEADEIDWIVLEDEAVELHLAGHANGPIADTELPAPVRVDDAAYLIYTSGSTGRPKAVAVTHRGLAELVANQRALLDLDDDSTVLHVASPSFDATVFELMMALGAHARLVVADADSYAGSALERVIAGGGVTHAVMTPSALATVAPGAVPTLTTVLSAGEACPPDLMETWVRAHRGFHNLYGPTEFTIWATADGPMSASDPITIGRAVPGTTVYVLDGALRPVADGVVGELYLAGEQLARGYRGRPDLTVAAFVADPFRPGQRMYRTGDRVARTGATAAGAEGKLVYHGRADFQLKIRGLRIEPAEVDAVLCGHASVANSLTLGLAGPAGDAVLVSYVSPREGRDVDEEALLSYARDHLPGYLVPAVLTVLDEFPRTPIGKIDRALLPAPEFAEDRAFAAPRSELEGTVAAVVAEVLGAERVSVRANFFDLGGNSLSAARVAARLTTVLGAQVPVSAVFDAPSVEQMAALLAAGRTGRPTLPLVARPRAAVVPVSAVQRGMWLLNRAAPESSAYNLPLGLRLHGPLDLPALRTALVDVLGRHESLRTVYPMIKGAPVQMIQAVASVNRELDFTIADLAGEGAEAVERWLADFTNAGFDVTADVPVRPGLVKVADDEHVFLLVVHHIGVDGASLAPLARDLMVAYAARRDGLAPHWAPLRLQPADYAEWQAERMALTGPDGITERDFQLEYWTRRLDGAPELLALPTDRPRTGASSRTGDSVEFEIPAALTEALADVARANNATLFMVAHTALAVLLGKLSGQTDIVIGTPYAGRGAEALDDVVGMFVNTVALRTGFRPEHTFTALLEEVRGNDLADLANTDVAFEEVVSALGRGATAGFNPLFQVMFTFQNLAFPTVELAGLTVVPEPVATEAVQNDLVLTLYPNDPLAPDAGGPMRAAWSYASDLFDEATVRRFAQWYVAVLEAIVADPHIAVGDIAVEHVLAPVAVAQPQVEATLPLPEALAAAALVDPDRVAVAIDGAAVTIGELAASAEMLLTVLPDGDGGVALTTALFAAIPALATGGPDALDVVLTQMRGNVDEALAGTPATVAPRAVPTSELDQGTANP